MHVQVNRGVSSPADISMDISKLVQLLGMTPVPFKDGVRLTLENDATSWHKENLYVSWLQFSVVMVKETYVYDCCRKLIVQGPIRIHGIVEWWTILHFTELWRPWNPSVSALLWCWQVTNKLEFIGTSFRSMGCHTRICKEYDSTFSWKL